MHVNDQPAEYTGCTIISTDAAGEYLTLTDYDSLNLQNTVFPKKLPESWNSDAPDYGSLNFLNIVFLKKLP